MAVKSLITRKEAATKLYGMKYDGNAPHELWNEMAEAKLVALFIRYEYSDTYHDMSYDYYSVVFRGAVNEEFEYDNYVNTIYIDSYGLVKNKCLDPDCPYHTKEQESAMTIQIFKGYDQDDDIDAEPWSFWTLMAHSRFMTFKDAKPYCQGIVFALPDATAKSGV